MTRVCDCVQTRADLSLPDEDLDLETTIAQEYFGLKLVTVFDITLYLNKLSNDATKYTVTFTAC